MEKQKITVTVAGKPYTLVSADPPEHVKRVAEYVDRELSETASATNLPSAQKHLCHQSPVLIRYSNHIDQ